MKLRILLTVLFLLVASVVSAAYPYDSVCRLRVPVRRGSHGGSGTLIAVAGDKALILTCRHVVIKPGQQVHAYWPAIHKYTHGHVVAVGRYQDIAAVICDRPYGLRPVLTRLPHSDSGPFTNVGYIRGGLQWQQGRYRRLSSTQLVYDARPVPGMSGGATFDRQGYLVGVITHYTPTGGKSSSGGEMIRFVDQFFRTGSSHSAYFQLHYGEGEQ